MGDSRLGFGRVFRCLGRRLTPWRRGKSSLPQRRLGRRIGPSQSCAGCSASRAKLATSGWRACIAMSGWKTAHELGSRRRIARPRKCGRCSCSSVESIQSTDPRSPLRYLRRSIRRCRGRRRARPGTSSNRPVSSRPAGNAPSLRIECASSSRRSTRQTRPGTPTTRATSLS